MVKVRAKNWPRLCTAKKDVWSISDTTTHAKITAVTKRQLRAVGLPSPLGRRRSSLDCCCYIPGYAFDTVFVL